MGFSSVMKYHKAEITNLGLGFVKFFFEKQEITNLGLGFVKHL